MSANSRLKKKFEHVTTQAFVDIYHSSNGIFKSLLEEVKDLSKKKPEATMSSSKVKMVNRVLDDLLIILKSEPTGKYLDRLDDEALPQMSDAVLVMVQFEAALKDFGGRYHKRVSDLEGWNWITSEYLSK